jgi:hypothetical protein
LQQKNTAHPLGYAVFLPKWEGISYIKIVEIDICGENVENVLTFALFCGIMAVLKK